MGHRGALDMHYAFTPAIWLPLMVLVALVALAATSWQRSQLAGARPFAVACALAALWQASAIWMTTAQTPELRFFWHRSAASLQLPAVTASMVFAVEYAQSGRWLTRRRLLLLALPSLALLALTWTNDWHHLVWLPSARYPVSLAMQGPAARIALALGWGLVLVNVGMFAGLFVRAPQLRPAVAVMIAGQVLARGYHVTRVALGSTSLPVAELSLLLMVSSGAYAVALYAFGLFDPLVMARRAAFAQMREGLIVLDAQRRVVHWNAAAAAIFGDALAVGGGLPALLAEASAEGLPAGAELVLGQGEGAARYAREWLALNDHNGQSIGQLLLLRDVTEAHRAQARLLSEQWALAAVQERELLANELHDTVSQTLASINLRAHTAGLHLQTGDVGSAHSHLRGLADVCLQAQRDVRELVGQLLMVTSPSTGFCDALRQLVQEQVAAGWSASLEIMPGAQAACDARRLAPATGVQLVRIAQEALTNVRKHAGPGARVDVRLELLDGLVRLEVADSGVGFDPADSRPGRHYGLQVMAQRAARIGGRLEVRSARGQGTQVVVQAPVAPAGPERGTA